MVLQYNLSTTVLAKQDSLARILSVSRPVAIETEQDEAAFSECYLHKVLSIITSVRDLQQEHSGDLTSAEVSRSTGYIEALLQQLLVQNKAFAHGCTAQRGIEKAYQGFVGLLSFENHNVSAATVASKQVLLDMKSFVSQASPALSVVSAEISAQAS